MINYKSVCLFLIVLLSQCKTKHHELQLVHTLKLDRENHADYTLNIDSLFTVNLKNIFIGDQHIFYEIEYAWLGDEPIRVYEDPFYLRQKTIAKAGYQILRHGYGYTPTSIYHFKLIYPNKQYSGAYISYLHDETIYNYTDTLQLEIDSRYGIYNIKNKNISPSESNIVLQKIYMPIKK